MSKEKLSRKATSDEDSDELEVDGVSILEEAKAEYEEEKDAQRERQREILQKIYKGVVALQRDDNRHDHFVSSVALKEAKAEPPSPEDGDNIWFVAAAFVYRARGRIARQRASKHASVLWLLAEDGTDPDQVADTIKERGGIQQLADEAADRRRGDDEDAASDDDEEGTEDEAADEPSDREDEDKVSSSQPRKKATFHVPPKFTAKLRRFRGHQVKIIAEVPDDEGAVELKIIRVTKVNNPSR